MTDIQLLASRALVPGNFVPSSQTELSLPDAFGACGGIQIGPHIVSALVFSTDLAVIQNTDAQAAFCVYPFRCSAQVNDLLVKGANMPVFIGVAGGITSGERSHYMALEAQNSGATAVVANLMTSKETLQLLVQNLSIPTVLTVCSLDEAARERIDMGVAILNVAAGQKTPRVVAQFRAEYPDLPLMASAGPSEESADRTVAAGADALVWTPPNIQDIERQVMLGHRLRSKN